MKSTRNYILANLSFLAFFVSLFSAPLSQAKTSAKDAISQTATEIRSLEKHWKINEKAAFFKHAFPKATSKDVKSLVSEWDQQTEGQTSFPFPKISAKGTTLHIGADSLVKISLRKAMGKNEILVNGVPFVYNERMGLRYNIKLMVKHLETTLAVHQNESLFDFLVPSAHAGIMDAFSAESIWGKIGMIAVAGLAVWAVVKIHKKMKDNDTNPLKEERKLRDKLIKRHDKEIDKIKKIHDDHKPGHHDHDHD